MLSRFITRIVFEKTDTVATDEFCSFRLDKLRGDPGRDQRLMTEVVQLERDWLREDIRARKADERDPQLDQFRWLLEELRVSLFAQELKTPMPVSTKRLARMWQTIQR